MPYISSHPLTAFLLDGDDAGAERWLNACASKLPEYIDKYYNCIFDEKRNVYDINKPHVHKIVGAWFVNEQGYICSGIALKIIVNGFYKIITGIKKEDIKNE